MTDEERQRLTGLGYHFVEDLPGGLWAGLHQFIYTCGIIVGQVGDPFGYDDRWCYHGPIEALAALAEWKSRDFKGEPGGWHRHPSSGRRRAPDGSIYVRP